MDRQRLQYVRQEHSAARHRAQRRAGRAGAPVTATGLRVSRFEVGASLRTNDSLADHRSRFYAEISRLREIVDLARAGKPTLFLLDELLSGTNSHDRRIGAEASFAAWSSVEPSAW